MHNSMENESQIEKKKLSILAEEIKYKWEGDSVLQEEAFSRLRILEDLREREQLESHAAILELSVENRKLHDIILSGKSIINFCITG